MTRRHALVLGGTGTIGARVVALFAQRRVPTTFTFFQSEEKARVLATEHGATAVKADLRESAQIRALFEAMPVVPDVLVHCAAVHQPAAITELEEADLDRAVAVGGRAALLAVRELVKRLPTPKSPAHVVLVGALDRTQALPLAASFAAAQGMMGPIAMALSKELGPRGICVNLVAGGLLGTGVSKALDPARVADFEKYSALRRLGTADEIAQPIAFLALENETMTGKILAANGGI